MSSKFIVCEASINFASYFLHRVVFSFLVRKLMEKLKEKRYRQNKKIGSIYNLYELERNYEKYY